jgi:hypothetical protein
MPEEIRASSSSLDGVADPRRAGREQWADIFANSVAANIDVSSPQERDMNNFVNHMLGIDVVETR